MKACKTYTRVAGIPMQNSIYMKKQENYTKKVPQRRNNICGSPNKYSCRTQMGRFQNIQRVVRDKGLQS